MSTTTCSIGMFRGFLVALASTLAAENSGAAALASPSAPAPLSRVRRPMGCSKIERRSPDCGTAFGLLMSPPRRNRLTPPKRIQVICTITRCLGWVVERRSGASGSRSLAVRRACGIVCRVARDSVTTSEELEALRRRLRSGNLPAELLGSGRDPVLRWGEQTITRDQLKSRAEEVSGGLHSLGVKPGDRVGLYAANSLNWVIAYVGSLRAGACVVPMNPDYRTAEAEHIISNSDPVLVVADIERAVIARELGRRVVPLEDLPQRRPPAMPALSPEDPALILYTSGTTGRPKGAVLEHGGMLAQARGAIEVWRWGASDILVHALPLFHLHGLGMGLKRTPFSGGRAALGALSPPAG